MACERRQLVEGSRARSKFASAPFGFVAQKVRFSMPPVAATRPKLFLKPILPISSLLAHSARPLLRAASLSSQRPGCRSRRSSWFSLLRQALNGTYRGCNRGSHLAFGGAHAECRSGCCATSATSRRQARRAGWSWGSEPGWPQTGSLACALGGAVLEGAVRARAVCRFHR